MESSSADRDRALDGRIPSLADERVDPDGPEPGRTIECGGSDVADAGGLETEAHGVSQSSIEATLPPLVVTVRRFLCDRRTFTIMERFCGGKRAREWRVEEHGLAVRCGHAGLFALGVLPYAACTMDDAMNAIELRRAGLVHGIAAAGRAGDINRLLDFALTRRAVSLECVLVLLELGANAFDEVAFAPLRTACVHGHAECVRALLDHGARSEAMDRVGRTPLHWACFFRRRRCALELLRHGANPAVRDVAGYLPGDLARDEGDPFLADAADLARTNCDAAVQRLESLAPFEELRQCVERGDVDRVRELLSSGVDPNHEGCIDPHDWTPLHVAASRGMEAIVSLLLEHGAHTETRNGLHGTALHMARLHGHRGCVLELVKWGADGSAKWNYGKE